MFRVLKWILSVVGGVSLVILLLPLVIIVVTFWGSLAFVRFIFEKIRRDPAVKLENLIDVPLYNDDDKETIKKNAIVYFEKLTTEIGKKGNAILSKTLISEDEEFIDDQKKITITRSAESKFAKISFKFAIDVDRDHNGTITYSSADDGDDFGLAGHINADIELHQNSDLTKLQTVIEYYQEAAYFCISILNGKGKYNSATGQMWSYIDGKKLWMVKTSSSSSSWFGYRKEYGRGKARLYWFDGK